MAREHVLTRAAMKIEAGRKRLSNLVIFPPREGIEAIHHRHRLAQN
jgi:hypothetical protein